MESANLDLKLWFAIYRTHNVLKLCDDQVFREYKLTMEQYVVLMTIKYFDRPARPSNVAQWLRRSPNSISMIVNRMVAAGLVRRVRDRKDRRVVWLVITSKGEEMLKPAFKAGLEVIWKTLSHVSYEDKQNLLRLLLTVQYEAATYLNPEADIEEIERDEAKRHDRFVERQIQAYCPQLPEAEYQDDEKEKTIR